MCLEGLSIMRETSLDRVLRELLSGQMMRGSDQALAQPARTRVHLQSVEAAGGT